MRSAPYPQRGSRTKLLLQVGPLSAGNGAGPCSRGTGMSTPLGDRDRPGLQRRKQLWELGARLWETRGPPYESRSSKHRAGLRAPL